MNEYQAMKLPTTVSTRDFLFSRFLQLLCGGLLMGIGAPLQAQIGSNFNNANEPVLLGNLSILANTPRTGVDALAAGNDLVLFVEGPVRINAMVHKQNPASERITGNPNLPDLNGTVSIRGQRFKVTSRSIVEAVLAQSGITDIRGYQLLWRGRADSLSLGFKQKVGADTLPPFVVGIRGRLLRHSAEDFISLNFFGAGGLNGRSLLETGNYAIRPGAAGGLLRVESGNRTGFVDCSGVLRAPLPGAVVDRFFVVGILSTRRYLGTLPPRTFLGQDFVGQTYERGTISGRITGLYDNP